MLRAIIERTVLVAGALLLSPASPVWSQTSEQALVEQHFADVAAAHDPGFAIGIVQHGELVAEHYVGMADLESRSRVGPETRFYIGSISKQFTAALIGQVVTEGRLSLTESIRAHLPELPAVYEPVTVADLLHHTGGVREYTSLMLLRGDPPSLEGQMSQANAMLLITSQRGLDFTPGTQQRYSSSGYVLLATLIERLHGEPFADVAARQIFAPLGMDSTVFDDDYQAVIRGRARSYRPGTNGIWLRWLKHFDTVGDGGVLTTIADMARWDAELNTGAILGTELREWMQHRGTLRDGTRLTSGPGLWHGSHAGQRTVQHGGGLGGFIADQIRFPDLGLSIYVFANRNDNTAFQAWRIADGLLQQRRINRSPVAEQAAPPAPVEGFDAWIGAYFLEDQNNRRFIRRDAAGRLALHGGGDEFAAHLRHLGGNRFETVPGGNEVRLGSDANGPTLAFTAPTYRWAGTTYDNDAPASLAELSGHAGSYCSTELEAEIRVTASGGRFTIRYTQGTPIVLFPQPSRPNVSWNGINRVWIGTHMLKFRVDGDGRTTGLGMGDGRVSNIDFARC